MPRTGTGNHTEQSRLVAMLLEADPWPHKTSTITLVETHISWVILTGPLAYKIKKSTRLGFLDFSTLERRRYFCEEELRLNRQWAPELYRQVVPISMVDGAARVGDDSNVVEYALEMVQFPPGARLDLQLKEDLLTQDDMLGLAATIAGYHRQVRSIPFTNKDDAFELVSVPVRENFPYVRQLVDNDGLNRIENWSLKRLRQLRPLIAERHEQGFVRECHGDLHLANLVRLETGIVPFDCIEFDPNLRDIDTISDFAFLAMDLIVKQRQDLAYTLITRYLELTGDFAGMELFGLYLVYHCMIRAKVAAIRHGERERPENMQHDRDEVERYCQVAERWINKKPPCLVAMHGYSGAGKTWASGQLLQALPAVRLRSDIERKRLFGLGETDSSHSLPGEGLYVAEASRLVYDRLFRLAEALLGWGYSVILDAAFLSKHERTQAAGLAGRLNVPFRLLSVSAAAPQLEHRLAQRVAGGAEVSEADRAVLTFQRRHSDALTDEERARATMLRTDIPIDWDELAARLR